MVELEEWHRLRSFAEVVLIVLNDLLSLERLVGQLVFKLKMVWR